MAEEILYQDDSIVLTKLYITIKRYYFPLATSKNIMFSDIEQIEIHDIDNISHRWGINSKYLNNWFNLDPKRAQKKKFIAIKIKNKNIKPTITPDDPDKVLQIIWQNQTLNGQKYAEKANQKPVQKQQQIAMQQLIEKEQQNQKHQQTNTQLK